MILIPYLSTWKRWFTENAYIAAGRLRTNQTAGVYLNDRNWPLTRHLGKNVKGRKGEDQLESKDEGDQKKKMAALPLQTYEEKNSNSKILNKIRNKATGRKVEKKKVGEIKTETEKINFGFSHALGDILDPKTYNEKY